MAILEYLIGLYKVNGRSIDRVDFKGRSALFNACKTGYMEAVNGTSAPLL